MFVLNQIVVHLSSQVGQIVGFIGDDLIIIDHFGLKARCSREKTRPATLDEALKSEFSTQHTILQKETFGALNDRNRFLLIESLSRFGVKCWAVKDAYNLDEDGYSSTIIIEWDKATAITKAMLLTNTIDTTIEDW